jgi:osmoprotectant transport system permease protein
MSEQPFIDWEWVSEHLDLIGQRFLEHVWLTFLAVAIGLIVSLPIAVFAHRHPRFYPPATWVTGILYTIPSIALLGFLVPFTGLSTLTAEIALVSYTLLILIRNTVTGLQGVPEDAKEAAVGMGLTRRQLLWRVEFPMALPVIVAGIRIATVSTIGLVLVTVLVGKGGLGYLMIAGFRRLLPQTTAVTLGVSLSVALAFAADALLLWGQRRLTPWSKGSRVRTVT